MEPMTLQDISLLIQILGMVVAAVWVVASVKSSTRSLSQTIEHLATEVGRLERVIERIETRTLDHEVRIQLMEQQKGNNA